MPQPIRTLRDRLRADTKAAHTRLDSALSGADIATREGLVHFLKVQGGGIALLRSSDTPPAVSEMIADLADRAARDLSALGEADAIPAGDGPSFEPLAVSYVSAGSRMGAKLLRRRWQSSEDPAVRAAHEFFGAPTYQEVWVTVKDQLEVIPGTHLRQAML